MICSNSTLDAENKLIATTLRDKSFPLNVVQTVITNEITEFNKIKQLPLQKTHVYLWISRLGGISERFAKHILRTIHRYYFSANVQVVFISKPISDI